MSPRHATPIADAIAAAGAKERNPSWGELWWMLGRAKGELEQLRAENSRLQAERLIMPIQVSEWVRDKPRELVEILEAADLIEPYGPPAACAWRLVNIGDPSILAVPMSELGAVIDAEVIEG